MEPLSAQDASFLEIEDDVSHMHIGSVGIFEGPPSTGEELLEGVGAKLQPGPALPPEGPLSAAARRPAGVDRRSILQPGVPRPAHGTFLPGRRGGAAHSDRAGHVPAAGPHQAAVGDVDRRGAGRRSLGAPVQGAPLHGRRGLGHRPALSAAGFRARACAWLCPAVDAPARALGGRPDRPAARSAPGQPDQRCVRCGRAGARPAAGGGAGRGDGEGHGRDAGAAATDATELPERPHRSPPALGVGPRAAQRREGRTQRPRRHRQRRGPVGHHAWFSETC